MSKTQELEQYRNDFLMKKYNKDKQELNEIITSFNNNFIQTYTLCFPCRFISYYYLKKFWKKLNHLNLISDFDSFKLINNECELFDADLQLYIKKRTNELIFNIPTSINISELSKYIRENKIEPYKITLMNLKPIITPSLFDEFDRDMLYKRQGRDMLEEIKSHNPIILMDGSEISRPYLINGNHRVIQAIRDGKVDIEIYIVTPEICSQFCITNGYIELYNEMLFLYKKVYGVLKKRIKIM